MSRNQYVLPPLPDAFVVVIIHRRARANAGVIDNDVNTAEVFGDFGYDSFDGLPIRNIKESSSHRITGFADFFNDLV